MVEDSFADLVQDKFSFLIASHGFRLVSADAHVVRLESPTLGVVAVWDPRGEVYVKVFRLGHETYGAWDYTGMVGKASVPRLLEVAGERMREDKKILLGDVAYYEWLEQDQRKLAEEWTAYYARKGPRPGPHRLS